MDELHQTLGRLLAQNEFIVAQQGELLSQNRELVQQNSDLHLQLQELRADQETLKQKLLEDILPDVEDYAKLKQRGVGVLAAFGAICGLIGMFAKEIVELYMKSKS
ncbi:MAG: protein of unknown function DUF1515 [Siphoviridae sp. ct7UA22]|nr:MAG: protein of unknown function DUF1515 [Siphoviridae sp. ct7UA22]